MPQSKITIYRNGKPLKDIKVSLEFSGISQNGFTSPEFTNINGVAIINHSSTGNANVYIDGQMKGKLSTPGEDIFYL